VEGGDEVVMLLASFIVAKEFALEDSFEEFAGDYSRGGRFVGGGGSGGLGAAGAEFEGVVGGAGVAIGIGSDAEKNVVGGIELGVTEAAIGIGEGAVKEINDLRSGEGVEDVDLGAREERGDDLERGIFGGGTDEEDVAGFDIREESVLLGFVEAMDFVNEDDGALSGVGFALGLGHDVLDFFDAAEDGAEGDEFAAGEAGDDAGERGLAATRRAPEEHGAEIIGFDLEAKRFAGAEEFFLADEFVEGAWAHALGEGLKGGGGVGFVDRGEETHGSSVAQMWIGGRDARVEGYQRSDISDQEASEVNEVNEAEEVKEKRKDNAEAQRTRRFAEKEGGTQEKCRRAPASKRRAEKSAESPCATRQRKPSSTVRSDCATKKNPRPRHTLRAWGTLRVG
jgi:hypothetical protein